VTGRDRGPKTYVITGGSDGIGLECASQIAAGEPGCRIVLVGRDPNRTAAAVGRIRAESPHCRVDALLCDLADQSAVRRLAEDLLRTCDTIDVLVNNAGTDRFAFFLHSTPDLWDVVLGVNLRGTLAVTHAVLPSMHERGGGVIVNVASEAGRVGSQGSVAYSAAKAGVIGFTKALARESARYGVRCNAVAPGPIETPLLNAAPEQLGELGVRLKQGMINATAMRRSGEPDEVASVIAFLASDDAAYVTGQTVGVSGGLSMW
jgi:2-hydroxycyclohexanecarboxyl-CoA dehydrogenase